jgi:hypothetical protein
LRTRARTLLLLAAALCGCDGDDAETCGAATPAPAEAALVTVGAETFSYGSFDAVQGGDCPVVTGSRESLTIAGEQPGSGFAFTLCLRQERAYQPGAVVDLGDAQTIQVVDVTAMGSDGCTYRRDSGATPSGTIAFEGYCLLGGGAYNLVIDGSIAGIKDCPGSSELVTMTIKGSVLVTNDPGVKR